MRTRHQARCLAAMVFFLCSCRGAIPALGQIPTEAAVEAAVTVPAPALVTSQPQATPEEIGDLYLMRQRYQAAIAAFKQDPAPSADVWNKMGIAYQMMFNLQDATRCYQASLKLNPKNSHVLNNLGTVYDSLKQYTAAERMFRRALKADPQSALIRKNYGTDLLSQRKYQQGWELYQQALTIDPKIFQGTSSPRVGNAASIEELGAMNYYMARGCARVGMFDRAIDYLRMALNEGFTNPKKVVADREFAGMAGTPAFEQLLAAQKAH
jgi:Tfp pilus assembly protein PilF